MKVSSLPNLNRVTTSFPNFFTLFQHPADHHHHHDTALQIHEHSCDTEASETSPYKAILSPSVSLDETNEIGFLAGTSSVGVFRSESEHNDRTRPNSVSVGSNQFGGSEWPNLPSCGGTRATSPISQETIEQPCSPLCPTKRASTEIHTFQFLEIKEATMTEAGTSKRSRSETPAPMPPFSKSLNPLINMEKGIHQPHARHHHIMSSLGWRVNSELFGQNEVANVFRRDFMGGSIALNTESGLIMVSRPPDQHGERNTSTACGTPSCNVEIGMEVEPVGQNQEANVFRRDFMVGPIALNTDGLTFSECSDAVAPSQPIATILDTIPHLTGGSSECAFQVNNQSMKFTANPYPNGLVDPHHQIALTQILSENMERLEDRRNLLAPQKEPLPEGHVFGSVNWTVRSCSDLALSQPMTTIPHTTGSSEYWRTLALREEHLMEENDYVSSRLTAPSSFDPGPSQPMHTIPHTMPTIPQMMPLLTERQDMRSVRLKATYGNITTKFHIPFLSGFRELEEEVSKRLEFEYGSFKLEYKDEDGDSVLIACDEDVRAYLQLLTSLGNQVIKLFVLDSFKYYKFL